MPVRPHQGRGRHGHQAAVLRNVDGQIRQAGYDATEGVLPAARHHHRLYAVAIERMTGKETSMPPLSEQWPAKGRTKRPMSRPLRSAANSPDTARSSRSSARSYHLGIERVEILRAADAAQRVAAGGDEVARPAASRPL